MQEDVVQPTTNEGGESGGDQNLLPMASLREISKMAPIPIDRKGVKGRKPFYKYTKHELFLKTLNDIFLMKDQRRKNAETVAFKKQASKEFVLAFKSDFPDSTDGQLRKVS